MHKHYYTDKDKPHLVVMFHGYSQNERYFDNLVTYLPQENITYVSLQAPFSTSQHSHYWFPLIDSPNFTMEKVIEVSEELIDWLQQQKNSYQRIILLGFSQGTEIISTILRHRPDLIDGMIMLSGIIIDRSHAYFNDELVLTEKISVFDGKDPNDFILPRSLVSYTNQWLKKYTDVTIKQYQGMGHQISDDEARDVAYFLKEITGQTEKV
ncbi:alpha/beta hydrolase [Fundicoccus culcitae]|uniref:Alpha/beta fold hydrolase n=1 Tax=Fundicoccus culcitae TaxID=2969821 RepID=A0ABY5P249_9LACT|nr:alpha/beta fold hydrolase [Fundicoccus culcitae]UUX32784.1 alpha/beta fold hydrolase [Fundicoccus culcitae]